MGEDDGIERKENGDCPAARFFPIRDNQKDKDTFRNGFLEDAFAFLRCIIHPQNWFVNTFLKR